MLSSLNSFSNIKWKTPQLTKLSFVSFQIRGGQIKSLSVLASSHCCTVSKGAIFCAIGGATPQKTKAPKLLSRAPLSATFGAPGPFRGTFQGQAAPLKRHTGLTPRKHITSNRCAQTLDRPQKCMDLRHLRAYWPTGPAPESQS